MLTAKPVIAKKEWKFVLILSCAIIIISILPYLYAFWITPSAKQFTGAGLLNDRDFFWYSSLIEQAREGDILFRHLSFPESQNPIIFHPLFLLMGWSAKAFNLPNALVYHLFRIMFGFIFLWVSYVFIAQFVKNVHKRKLAFVFLASSSGLGWLTIASTQLGRTDLFIDVWMKEISGFLTIINSPLDLASITLMLIIFLFFMELLRQNKPLHRSNFAPMAQNGGKYGISKKSNPAFDTAINVLGRRGCRMKYALLCGLAALALLLIHPYEVLTVSAVLLLYLAYSAAFRKIQLKPLWKEFLLIFLLALPGFAYNYYAVTFSPPLKFWFGAAGLPSPGIISYLLGFGLLALFAFIAIYKILKERLSNLYFIVIWLVAAFFLAYQPWIHFQIKFLIGIEIAVAILASEGTYAIHAYAKEKMPEIMANSLILFLVAATFFTNIIVFGLHIASFNNKSMPYYIDNDYLDAAYWIRINADKKGIILAHDDISYFLPSVSSNPIFFGLLSYGATEYTRKKASEVRWFFGNCANGTEKYDFLKKNNISYLFYTPEIITESNCGETGGNKAEHISNAFNPERINGLKKVYSNKKTAIYKVE